MVSSITVTVGPSMVPEIGDMIMKQTLLRRELGRPSLEGWFPHSEDRDPERKSPCPNNR